MANIATALATQKEARAAVYSHTSPPRGVTIRTSSNYITAEVTVARKVKILVPHVPPGLNASKPWAEQTTNTWWAKASVCAVLFTGRDPTTSKSRFNHTVQHRQVRKRCTPTLHLPDTTKLDHIHTTSQKQVAPWPDRARPARLMSHRSAPPFS